MLEAVDEMTAGQGSNFFLVSHRGSFGVEAPAGSLCRLMQMHSLIEFDAKMKSTEMCPGVAQLRHIDYQ
jgi:hypothetical protein